MKYRMLMLALSISAAALTTGCGRGGVTLQANPLAGPSAAKLLTPQQQFFANAYEGLMKGFLGVNNAVASVSSFTTFKMCVDTVTYETLSGEAKSPTTPLQPGLISFSPTATTATSIAQIDIPKDTVLKNIKFTVANVPAVCSGADYSVLFNVSGTDIKLTQNVAFRFDFGSSGYTISGADQNISLFLGNIVNGMVTLANTTGLTNDSIQTVNVGQAQ